MGYVESSLSGGERVVHRGELHWVIYLAGILLTPFLIGVPLLLFAYLRKRSTEMAVTNKRVVLRAGVLSTRTFELALSKVERVGVDQSVLGRALGYGTVIITGTGGTRAQLGRVVDPFAFRHAVQAHVPAPAGDLARAAG